MNIEELKKMLNTSPTLLVIDGDNPSFVVLKYDAYEDLVSGQSKEIKISSDQIMADPVGARSGFGEEEMEILERINKDIQALKNELEKEEKVLEVGE